MPKHCAMCYSTSFRLSKIRRGDVPRLLFLLYPVRCLECFKRASVFLLLAMKYRPIGVRSPQEKRQKA
jgi:hypothetical protein